MVLIRHADELIIEEARPEILQNVVREKKRRERIDKVEELLIEAAKDSDLTGEELKDLTASLRSEKGKRLVLGD